MQPWFEEAKLGIFIHYGIYAVDGVSESWSFYNGRISYEDYMKQLDLFYGIEIRCRGLGGSDREIRREICGADDKAP